VARDEEATVNPADATEVAPAPDTPLLDTLSEPSMLRRLDHRQLARLATEIRQFLVRSVSRTGGHLGPNLGLVELTMAVHRTFDSPRDSIVFDTGHQAYVHKLITGRAAAFPTLRQRHGLSGFPSRRESPHDVVENSHASTGLAYADGLAKARRLTGDGDRPVVVVLGDGALTGGMAWEGLNNLGGTQLPVVVVLNDNQRSYDPTVGGVARHLRALRTEPRQPGQSIFEQLGFDYVGPVDGHDLVALEAALETAKQARRPSVVHAVTVKGRGHEPAEQDPVDCYHSIGPASALSATLPPRSWTSVVGEELEALMASDPRVVCLTAAMQAPLGLARIAERFPDRTYDVGIAEQHAVTSAAGLAMAGLHPVVVMHSSFLNRAFDQFLMDVALHGCAVTVVLDRAGITGEDGPSHHGMWDLSILQPVPGLRMAAPRDTETLRAGLREAVNSPGPTLLRIPKASGPDRLPAQRTLGTVDVLRSGGDVLLVAVGSMCVAALGAAELLEAYGVDVGVCHPRWVRPVPAELVSMAADHRLVVTVEDGCRVGGFGAAYAQQVAYAAIGVPVVNLGIPAAFIDHGRRGDLLAELRLDGAGVAAAVAEHLTNRGLFQGASAHLGFNSTGKRGFSE
jgi:1-deoxy-D-xylulose-5-phosphate synthase